MTSTGFREALDFQMNTDATMRAMRRLLSGSCLLAGFASSASACLFFTSNQPFDVSVPETFQWDKARLNRALPAPKLLRTRIDRLADIPTDYRQRIESCRSGMISVWIRRPRAGTARLEKTGFRFKLLTSDSGLAVDDVPVTGVREGDSMRFDFLLFDSHYTAKHSLDAKMEVYIVNAKGERGPASVLALQAPVARSLDKQFRQ